ncbi:MAG: hypothetical protein IKB22_06420 [Lentisphaeria bacterium]|nr:hypothetical protein [Lentisphaeria bacterium]
MKKFTAKTILTGIIAGAALLFFTGCEDSEKTVDMEETKEAVSEGAEDLGKSIEDGAEDLSDSLEKAFK